MQLSKVVSASSVMIDFICVMNPGCAADKLWLCMWVVMPWKVRKGQSYLLAGNAGSIVLEDYTLEVTDCDLKIYGRSVLPHKILLKTGLRNQVA